MHIRSLRGLAGTAVVVGFLWSAVAPLTAAQIQPGLAPIELTCVDPAATGYGTFQSHNQKLVSNRRGFFGISTTCNRPTADCRGER